MGKKQIKEIFNLLTIAKKEFDYCKDNERARLACKFVGMFEISESVLSGINHDKLFSDFYKTYEICERYHQKIKSIKNSLF